MRQIDTVIVHCSATPPGRDIGVKEIRDWHVNDNGWSDIGYHYVIRRDGTLEIGRPIHRAGAHTKGHNEGSIGICLVGGTRSYTQTHKREPEFNFTYRQLHKLLVLITDAKSQYDIKRVAGHRDFDDGKACPCFNVGEWFNG